jgi:hypothetical protein
MGEAKRRGTYGERVVCAIAAQVIIEQAMAGQPKHVRKKLLGYYNGNRVALAWDLMQKAQVQRKLDQTNKIADTSG